MTDYIKIDWPDVKAGDVLMHENGDRLTVRRVDGVWISVPGSQRNRDYWEPFGFSPYRKVEPLPTEPGAYLDKDGNLCVLGGEGLHHGSAHWLHFGRTLDSYIWLTDRVARTYAPFTRLVPMPTEERIEAVAIKEVRGSDRADTAMRVAAAVMAPLSGDAGSTECES